ncbi:MAG: hypothetical protein MZV64_16665 [Ignavibacteriales bacterium]|nr:hypothetical protein [Ignavibacteriales bacterium]
MDGNHEPALREEIETISRVAEAHGAIDAFLAEEPAKVRELWDLRRGIGEAVKSVSPYKKKTRSCRVPSSRPS